MFIEVEDGYVAADAIEWIRVVHKSKGSLVKLKSGDIRETYRRPESIAAMTNPVVSAAPGYFVLYAIKPDQSATDWSYVRDAVLAWRIDPNSCATPITADEDFLDGLGNFKRCSARTV